jgi:hypothetical protein
MYDTTYDNSVKSIRPLAHCPPPRGSADEGCTASQDIFAPLPRGRLTNTMTNPTTNEAPAVQETIKHRAEASKPSPLQPCTHSLAPGPQMRRNRSGVQGQDPILNLATKASNSESITQGSRQEPGQGAQQLAMTWARHVPWQASEAR